MIKRNHLTQAAINTEPLTYAATLRSFTGAATLRSFTGPATLRSFTGAATGTASHLKTQVVCQNRLDLDLARVKIYR